MRKKYHGTVYANGRAVYADRYETRRKAVADLKRQARETALNSPDENVSAGFTLSLRGMVVAGGEIPGRRFPRRYAGPAWPAYGLIPSGGTKIC
jgi:hypothetical protein